MVTRHKQGVNMETKREHDWRNETDQQLLNRHKETNVRGIEGETFWCKMDELHNYLKKRNLI